MGLGGTTLPSAVASVLRTEEDLEETLGQAGTSTTTFCLDCRAPVKEGEQCPCNGSSRAAEERQGARLKQEQQAARMLKRSREKMETLSVGQCVRVGIPDVDRSRIEHRNLLCVVLEVRARAGSVRELN